MGLQRFLGWCWRTGIAWDRGSQTRYNLVQTAAWEQSVMGTTPPATAVERSQPKLCLGACWQSNVTLKLMPLCAVCSGGVHCCWYLLPGERWNRHTPDHAQTTRLLKKIEKGIAAE